ncbi:MAG: hypothetical protein LBG19_07520 [Prevotellaceae bacterium]|jgi:hypothetical protein|nr:hypothetical protein [Prevotellaceae bacterium]
MKKLLLIIVCAFLGIQLASAQYFSKGDFVLNAGIGFGNTLHTGSGMKTTVPPISASLEYCIIDNLFDENSSIGIGGVVGYSAQKYKYDFDLSGGKYEVKNSDFLLGTRGSFHYQFVDKLDTYASIVLAYDIVSASSSDNSSRHSADAGSFFSGVYVGARYYFTQNFAAMAEMGYDIAVFKIGVAVKF